jgi:NTP pyrophosphatase (non-canonical NTP hydrolase)
MDKMDFKEMMDDVKNYHIEMGYNRIYISKEAQMRDFRDNALALFQEVAEMTDSAPWKPWRKIKDQELDIPNLKMELVDILFFVFSIAEIFNISPLNLEIMFLDKLKENYDRLQRGYNKNQKK